MCKAIENIALFGGTFAPPHLGHVHAVETVLHVLNPDRVIVMPTAIPPHKRKANGDTQEARLQMCRAAFGHLPKTEISSYEITKGGVSYTVETLEHLKNDKNRIFLLCGSDMFLTLESWFRAERIFELASIVCMPRYDSDLERLRKQKQAYEERFAADVRVIETDALELSSTEIRERIRKGENLNEVLPEGVIEIIRQNKLYDR